MTIFNGRRKHKMAKKTKTKTKSKAKKQNKLEALHEALLTAVSVISKRLDKLEGTQDIQVQKVAEKPKSDLIVKGAFDNPDPFPKSTSIRSQAVNKKPSKNKYQLLSYDEYNSQSILASGADLSSIFREARNYVTETNLNNSLASTERDKAWEAYFPVVMKDGSPDPDILYAGNKRNGTHQIYVRGETSWELKTMPQDTNIQFFLGEISQGRSKTDWYLKNHRGVLVTSLSDIMLDNKTVLFVKVL